MYASRGGYAIQAYYILKILSKHIANIPDAYKTFIDEMENILNNKDKKLVIKKPHPLDSKLMDLNDEGEQIGIEDEKTVIDKVIGKANSMKQVPKSIAEIYKSEIDAYLYHNITEGYFEPVINMLRRVVSILNSKEWERNWGHSKHLWTYIYTYNTMLNAFSTALKIVDDVNNYAGAHEWRKRINYNGDTETLKLYKEVWENAFKGHVESGQREALALRDPRLGQRIRDAAEKKAHMLAAWFKCGFTPPTD